jgi:hypothetical protein
MIEPEIAAALRRAGEIQKVSGASPTWKEMEDAFGKGCLRVTLADGSEVEGWTIPDGRVRPMGQVRVQVCHPLLSEEQNFKRMALFNEMMRKRRALQIDQSEEVHATTNHVVWNDAAGEKRSAPEEAADRILAKVGVRPMTHPKVWRPS